MSQLSDKEKEELNNAFLNSKSGARDSKNDEEHIDFLADLQNFAGEKKSGKTSAESAPVSADTVSSEGGLSTRMNEPYSKPSEKMSADTLNNTILGKDEGNKKSYREVSLSDDFSVIESESGRVGESVSAEERESEDTDLNAVVLGNNKKFFDEQSAEEHHHHEHSHHSSGRRKKHTARKVVVGILIAVLVIILAAIVTVFFMHQRGKRQTLAPDYGEKFENAIVYKGVTYIYNKNMTSIAFLGVDREKFGLEDKLVGTAGQSDVNMVIAVNTQTGAATIIVLPRDTLCDIDKYSLSGEYMGTDKTQLCLAYAYGDGKATSCRNSVVAIQRILYGVPINTYAALNLDGVPALNDCIGGVTLTCTSNFLDKYYKGEQITLKGQAAQEYIRARDEDLTGDAQRRERQIQYVKAYVSKAAKKALSNSNTLKSIYDTGKQYAVTNLTLSRGIYLGTTVLTKNAAMLNFENVVTLTGKLKCSSEGYAETILDDDKALQEVLSIYYTPAK